MYEHQPGLPPIAPAPPQHPAPPEGWRPLSGLCLSAFILALVLGLLAFTTLWVGLLLPLGLGIAALMRVDGERFRGRALAWWAVGISIVIGGFSFHGSRSLNEGVRYLADGLLSALRSERDAADKSRLVEEWLLPGPDRATNRKRIEERYADAVAKLGPQRGSPLPRGIWAGSMPVVIPPSDVHALDDPGPQGAPGVGPMWVVVPFERGDAHMALWLGQDSAVGRAEALTSIQGSGSVPVIRDVRFYARRTEPRDPASGR